MDLPEETQRATNLLKGKVISSVTRLREKEIMIEFIDGTRLFVDWKEDKIKLSITVFG